MCIEWRLWNVDFGRIAVRKVVISVGMGPQQLAFIKRLKENGYTVVAFGKEKKPAEEG